MGCDSQQAKEHWQMISEKNIYYYSSILICSAVSSGFFFFSSSVAVVVDLIVTISIFKLLRTVFKQHLLFPLYTFTSMLAFCSSLEFF